MKKPPVKNVPALDQWPIRSGVLKAYFLVNSKETEEQVAKRVESKQDVGPLPLAIRLWCHIFRKEIIVAMGDRAKCQDLFCQLTDTNGDLEASEVDTITCGLCFQIRTTQVAIWVRSNWQELRKGSNVPNLGHEALHAAERIMHLVGMAPHPNNEELRAYYQTWIQDAVMYMVEREPWDWMNMGIDTRVLVKSESA